MVGVQLSQGYRANHKYHLVVSRSSWYSFSQPQKDERVSLLWSHAAVWNPGPLDWESNTLTTRPLLIQTYPSPLYIANIVQFQ